MLFLLGSLIVILTMLVIISFTPYGFYTLLPRKPIIIGDSSKVEYVPIVEYTILRPKVYISTLNFLAHYLKEDNFTGIIGDRVFCTGFMYIGKRDLYETCVSIHNGIRLGVETNKIVSYHFDLLEPLIVISYPVIYAIEEPIEYRCNTLREVIISSISTIYNSGMTVIGWRE